MTALTRPVRAMLESVFDAPPGPVADDIERLRSVLTVALRRCLDAPDADWGELVDRATRLGDWDEWRGAGLRAASAPDEDPDPSTRETLAELVEELIGRGDIEPGPWHGADRQESTRSPEWIEGRRRREIVFAIERAVVALSSGDAECLRDVAVRIAERDPDASIFPRLPATLMTCADELGAGGAVGPRTRADLSAALVGTPFAAAVDVVRPG